MVSNDILRPNEFTACSATRLYAKGCFNESWCYLVCYRFTWCLICFIFKIGRKKKNRRQTQVHRAEKKRYCCVRTRVKWGIEVIFILRLLLPHFMYVMWLAVLSSSVSSRCLTSGSLCSLFCLIIFKHDQVRCVLKGGRDSRNVKTGAGPENKIIK